MLDRVSHSDSLGSKVPAGNWRAECPVVVQGLPLPPLCKINICSSDKLLKLKQPVYDAILM